MSSFMDSAFHQDRVLLHGHGFGHGVGLCQYGTEARARAGEEFERILDWYYPAATIEVRYG